MGVEYSLISDTLREGYELGKGAWGDPAFAEALRSIDPISEVVAFLVEEDDFEPIHAVEIAQGIAAFTAAHPDWRVVDDGGWAGDVVDDEWRAIVVDEGWDPMDPDFPLYKQVGSRYRQRSLRDDPIAWSNLTERQRETVLRHREKQNG